LDLPLCVIEGLSAMGERARNFSTLEKMCLERAEIAEREKNYWLAEAAEWRRLKNSCAPYIESAVTRQLDCFLDLERATGFSPE
jgi:hypothetical protein